MERSEVMRLFFNSSPCKLTNARKSMICRLQLFRSSSVTYNPAPLVSISSRAPLLLRSYRGLHDACGGTFGQRETPAQSLRVGLGAAVFGLPRHHTLIDRDLRVNHLSAERRYCPGESHHHQCYCKGRGELVTYPQAAIEAAQTLQLSNELHAILLGAEARVVPDLSIASPPTHTHDSQCHLL